jgi:hypothetical protein
MSFSPAATKAFYNQQSPQKGGVERGMRSFLPRKIDEILRGVGQVVAGELSRLRYYGPIATYPPRHLAFSQHHESELVCRWGLRVDVFRRDDNVRKLVNEWLSAPDRLQTPYELILRDLVGIDQLDGPLLDGLEQIELDMEPDYDDSTTPTGAYPVVKDPEAEAAKLRELIRASDIDKLNELIMIDRRSNTVVSHRDVGIGVSQVLPILVGAYASRNQIVAIEQPEIICRPASRPTG